MMGKISNVLRSVEGGGLMFRCPGCNESHVIYVGVGDGPRWGWNGNVDAPTFTPSVLVTGGHYMPGWQSVTPEGTPKQCWCTYNEQHPEEDDPFTCMCCHSFINNGQIQFLNDCTHALAGQTVPLGVFE